MNRYILSDEQRDQLTAITGRTDEELFRQVEEILADCTRYILTQDQRDQLSDITGCMFVCDEEFFLRIEEILTDYNSNKEVLDKLPKAAETRKIFSDISKYAEQRNIYMLNKKIKRLYDDKKYGDKRMRWARVEYESRFGKLTARNVEELAHNAKQLSDVYADRKTPRRTDQVCHARDFALEDLIEVFDKYSRGEFLEETDSGQSVINPMYLDNCEKFVATVFGFTVIDERTINDPNKIEKYYIAERGNRRRK